jgi:hypothetical protein
MGQRTKFASHFGIFVGKATTIHAWYAAYPFFRFMSEIQDLYSSKHL